MTGRSCDVCGMPQVDKIGPSGKVWYCDFCGAANRIEDDEQVHDTEANEFEIQTEQFSGDEWDREQVLVAVAAALERSDGSLTTSDLNDMEAAWPSYATVRRYVDESWSEIKRLARQRLDGQTSLNYD